MVSVVDISPVVRPRISHALCAFVVLSQKKKRCFERMKELFSSFFVYFSINEQQHGIMQKKSTPSDISRPFPSRCFRKYIHLFLVHSVISPPERFLFTVRVCLVLLSFR
mmetsp:Transcript_6083/g.14944  ORF Transcript_6083/g.14944 Transcript_6083/m.14944 type:complete len:109 (-) Transcript_6083:589-915(-)